MILHNPNKLPPADDLEISRLEAIFRSKTNSYKYLLLRTIIDWVEKFPQVRSLTYPQLQMLMLLDAAEPLRRYRLSFGTLDDTNRMVGKVFEQRKDLSDKRGRTIVTVFEGKIDDFSASEAVGKLTLIRYAPYRLLTPWFTKQLRGLPDGKKNERIEELSRECFDSVRPLYCIVQGTSHKAIELHPDWKDYIRANLPIVRGWCLHKWLLYLQRRNQNVPMLAEKIAPAALRSSLEKQRKFWRPAVSAGFSCIYTARKIDPGDFALDHFLPFDWVGHDQLWNLVPTSKETNSAKSNRIPSKSLIDNLAQAHWQALVCNSQNEQPNARKVDDYLSGLNMSLDDLRSPEILRTRYQLHIKPSIDQALLYGFDKFKP
ncbi:MAG: hypothetical protein OXC81_07755 [Betaproteobacteria bacterium]|nr:hypothetical protein [Betaproteobacteria bacterium]